MISNTYYPTETSGDQCYLRREEQPGAENVVVGVEGVNLFSMQTGHIYMNDPFSGCLLFFSGPFTGNKVVSRSISSVVWYICTAVVYW